MGRKTGLAIKGLAAAGAAMAAGFIVNNLKDMITQSLDYVSSLQEVATQLGVSTSALQQYRFMASQVGIEQSEMDRGLGFLSKTLGQFSLDSDKASKVLEKYGFSTKEVAAISKSTAEEALPLLADKYKALSSETEKAAFVAELFGAKLGGKFKTLLEGGAEGINSMSAAYHKLGIELSPEMIQRADDARDKFAAVKAVLDAKMAMAVAQNADKLLKLADAMIQGITAAGNFYTAITSFTDTKFGQAILSISNLLNPFHQLVNLLTIANKLFGETAVVAPKALAAGNKAAGAAVTWPSGGTGKAPASVAKPTAAPLGSMWSKGKGGAMLAQVSVLGGLDFDSIYQKINELGVQASDSVISNFDKIQEQGQTVTVGLKTSFNDAAESIIGSMGRVASAIKGGGFLDILSGVLDLGLQLAGIGAFGKKIQTNVNTPHYALGTNFARGGMSLVGERGPELVNLPRGSKVTPNHKMGGNTYNINGVITTDQFWSIIQAGNANAAQAGAKGGVARIRHANSRSLAR
jgi:hypothetical protein